MAYEVQTYTICQGWINCWSIDGNGVSKPQIFETRADAQAEIDAFMADIQAQIDSGERALDEGYDLEDYRIVEIADKRPTLR